MPLTNDKAGQARNDAGQYLVEKVMGTAMGFIGTVFRLAIRGYRLLLLPVMPAGGCRFTPSCSEYAEDAICRHGPFEGGWLAVKRILRCHPWGKAGFDPVPPRTAKSDPDTVSNIQGHRG